MSDLAQLVTTDGRTPVEKLRRHYLRRIAKEHGVSIPDGAPKTQIVKLIEGAGIDVTRPVGELKWAQQPQYNEDGQVIGAVMEPVTPAPGSARAGVTEERRMRIVADNAQRIEEEEAEAKEASLLESLTQENRALKEMIDTRLAALEKAAAPPVLPLDSMNTRQLLIMCDTMEVEHKKSWSRLKLRKSLETAGYGQNAA